MLLECGVDRFGQLVALRFFLPVVGQLRDLERDRWRHRPNGEVVERLPSEKLATNAAFRQIEANGLVAFPQKDLRLGGGDVWPELMESREDGFQGEGDFIGFFLHASYDI